MSGLSFFEERDLSLFERDDAKHEIAGEAIIWVEDIRSWNKSSSEARLTSSPLEEQCFWNTVLLLFFLTLLPEHGGSFIFS